MLEIALLIVGFTAILSRFIMHLPKIYALVGLLFAAPTGAWEYQVVSGNKILEAHREPPAPINLPFDGAAAAEVSHEAPLNGMPLTEEQWQNTLSRPHLIIIPGQNVRNRSAVLPAESVRRP